MKKTLALSITILIIFSISSCITISKNKKSVCDTMNGDCYICEIANRLNTTPEDIGNIIKLANIVAISKDKYTAKQALDKLKEIRSFLNAPVSYLFVKNTLLTIKNKYPEVFMISLIYLNELNSPSIMLKNDQNLIIKWIDSLIIDMEFLSAL